MLGGALCATGLLLHQELFEPVGGEGESLPPQLHQVGVLQPGEREAVSCSWSRPDRTHRKYTIYIIVWDPGDTKSPSTIHQKVHNGFIF